MKYLLILPALVVISSCSPAHLLGMTKEQMAEHKEFCREYAGTEYDCTLPDPNDKIYIPAWDVSIERGKIIKRY
jgi:hypothetical protein